MSSTTILQLPVAIAVDGAEWIEIVQDGVSRRLQLSRIATLIPDYTILFIPLAAAPANPTVGMAYFDTTLGYPRVYLEDGQWHGLMMS